MNARWLVPSSLTLAVACGSPPSPEIRGELKPPAPSESRIALTPALDLSGMIDPELAERIAIEEISVNLTDLRLLGSNPKIPAGGLELLDGDRLLSTRGGADAAAEFPFAEELAADSLALSMKIGATPALRGASIIVKARLYAQSHRSNAASLTSSDEDESPDPDGDPADKSPDPDGDPADKSPDPDGDPAAS